MTLNTPEWTLRLAPRAPNDLSKVRQLYLNLYEAITCGELPDGQQLPSSRQLSRQLDIGRNTVIAAYGQLHDEGLINSAGRQGTRVSFSPKRQLRTVKRASTNVQTLSERAKNHAANSQEYPILAPGMPDPELFPKDAWRKALQVAARLPFDKLGYGPRPLAALQASIARHLSIYRSLSVEADQIVITSGTRQSLCLAATMYADRGGRAWVESPGYRGAVDAFKQHGLGLASIPIDGNGHDLEVLSKSKAASMIYLTPCFQFPMGGAMSAERRAAVLAFAQRSGSVIFEDDYDSEFRDDSEARPALASQAEGQLGEGTAATVLHAGTFSKLIFPAARIAWLVVPREHIDVAHSCLRIIGGGHNFVAQATIAELLENGSVARHLQRSRAVYTQRRQVLWEALDASGQFGPLSDTGGSLSMVAPFRRAVPTNKLNKKLQEYKLGAQLLGDLYWDKKPAKNTKAVVLGLGNVSSLKIPQAVDRLLAAMS